MKLLIPCFLLISILGFSQDTEKRGTIKIEKSNCVRVEKNDSVYAFVDKMPEFFGGHDSLMKWMNQNLRYPKSALEESVFGTVHISIGKLLSTVERGLLFDLTNIENTLDLYQ